MKNSKLKWLIGVFPLVFFIHDIEEIVTVEDFLIKHSNVLSYKVTTIEFALAFFILWVITFIGCIRAVKNKCFLGMKPTTFFSLLISGIFLANGIGHILQFIFFREYVPGVITSIFILIPYCFVSIKWLLKEKLITRNRIFVFLFLGSILQAPFALTAILIAKVVLLQEW